MKSRENEIMWSHFKFVWRFWKAFHVWKSSFSHPYWSLFLSLENWNGVSTNINLGFSYKTQLLWIMFNLQNSETQYSQEAISLFFWLNVVANQLLVFANKIFLQNSFGFLLLFYWQCQYYCYEDSSTSWITPRS